MLITRTVDGLESPSLGERQAILDGPVSEAAFTAAFGRLPALTAIEHRAPPTAAAPVDRARIVFWNAERLKYFEASVGFLGGLQADALLLCEVDVGMARSDNRHTIAELAARLGSGYLFAAEFVELDLGDQRERSWHLGQMNAAGLHGGGIVSRHRLARPGLIRLETSGRWFNGAFGERRVGGRIAVAAEIPLAGTTALLVSAHYESHTDPEDRLLSTRVMLDAVDAHAPGRPVLIGGDFNTSTFSLPEKRDAEIQRAALLRDPMRLVDPVAYEPMFAELSRRGYDWARCNFAHAATQRTRPDGTPAPPFGKIDWLFSRGLRCEAPAILAAVDAKGVTISDHEALAVTIALE
ncbi:MAG: endonuclease/exonuclease/phosphatase family protein [Proteobacteria bacterium]|nr:endonuclease/exonuclease/phosphatase family protein [Pseudomonadota bacterium]MBI3498662.1 endonuclease/exonuclease/phosphatase family protein [Pseudomonadota bacterium]